MRPRSELTACIAVLVVVALTSAAAAEVSVHAVVDRDQVFVGEPFTLTIEVEGTQRAEVPDLGELGPFDASYVGPATRFSSVNGRVTTSVGYRYALTGRQQGSFRLGPFRVVTAGAAHETAPITVRVAPRSSVGAGEDGGEDMRLVVAPEKTTAFVGERVPFSVELFVGDVAVGNLRFPTVDADGFAVDGFVQPGRREEIVRNRRWSVLKFRSTLTPLRPGTLAVGPTRMALEVVEQSRRRGSLFDDLIGATQSRPVELYADPVNVEVRPLPSEGRPAGFSGAVGQFAFDVDAAPLEVAAGDPITVRMEIRGVGNLESVVPPRVPAGAQFRAYDPTVVAGSNGPGRMSVEQVLIPRDATATQLAPVSFSFFEPETGAYRTVTRGPIAISVRPSAPNSAAAVLESAAREPQKVEEKLGRDIVYIKDRAGDLVLGDRRFYTQWWFAVLALVPVLAVGAMDALVRRRRALLADPRLARYQRAGRLARRRLSALSSSARDGAFYDELTAAMRGYLADKLDLAPGAVDRANVAARLESAGAAAALRDKAARFFDVTEPARYAPGARNGDPGEALELANALVRGLERERGIARRLGVVAVILALVVAATGAVGRSDAQLEARVLDAPAGVQGEATPLGGVGERDAGRRDPHTIFFEGNAAYKGGDYRTAAREYERLLSAGFASGALHYNLGNAYFKQRMYGRAILAYERARRLLPRDADLGANLAYARESAEAPRPEVSLWQRIVFAPALTLSTGELAVVCMALWWAAWAWLGLRAWRRRPEAASMALWGIGLALLVLGSSLAFRWWRLEGRHDAVVVAAGESVARFEPSETGKEYFRIGEGSVVRVRRERSGWVQVARDDDLRGWVQSGSVELIGRRGAASRD